ncbi:MAG: hydroxyacid dehydrogenase [Rubrivivax sp. SCN 70-15]|nr:MAG: hydroxyacid dehydrogenase [Rubrivivax sp. SCN 70-15]
MSRLGFVGIGNMGLAMALRLRDAGHAVQVRDIDAGRVAQAVAAGATAAATPAGLAGCELVIVAVVDAAQTREVLFGADGLAAALAPGATVMLCPTIAPADTEACAARLAERGIGCIDAPMSGGPERARDGTMSLMVACDDALFARWQPVLCKLASRLLRIGERVGDGARTKLVNNLLAAINLAGAAEVMALAGRLGLDAARTLAVIEQSSGQSWIGSDRMQRALAGDAAPRAHMALLAKDSALALAAARAAGATLPVGEAAAAQFAAALAAGLARADDSALWPWLAGRG